MDPPEYVCILMRSGTGDHVGTVVIYGITRIAQRCVPYRRVLPSTCRFVCRVALHLRRRQESEIDFHKLGFILMAGKALRVRLIFVKSQSYLAYLNNASADDHRNADRTIIKSTVAARIKCCFVFNSTCVNLLKENH